MLFEQGLADPRGCDYREIEIVTGSVWGGKQITGVHGWVLPSAAGETNQFAVCWNGLVYPLATVGARADLAEDVTSLLKAQPNIFNRALPDGQSASQTTLLPIKACLLLRLGRGDDAYRVMVALRRGTQAVLDASFGRAKTNAAAAASFLDDELLGNDDPYLGLASDWAWALFDRTIWAHMHGDDRLALLGARELARIEKLIESEASKRGIKRPAAFITNQRNSPPPYLGFLEPLPELLADQERRAREPKRQPVLEVGLDRFPDPTQRVVALVRDLEFVSARQSGQPGWVSLAQEPIAGALRGEGDGAVDALIDCLESDPRLTRSVGFGRDFHQGRSLVDVKQVARSLLRDILQKSLPDAAAYRKYWGQFKELTLHQRWYRQLADDAAGADAWSEAAARIVAPANVSHSSGWTITRPRKMGEKVGCTGESLRTNAQPALSELLARRALSVFPTNLADPDAPAALDKACSLGRALAIWDGPAAVPVVRTQMQRCIELSAQTNGAFPSLAMNIARLAQRRAEAGDTNALDEYAAWLQRAPAAQVQPAWREVAGPLWRFPEHPSLHAAGERLFGELVPIQTVLTNGADFGRPHFIETPAVGIPALQAQLIRNLTNREPSFDTYGRTNGRICDEIAGKLSGLGGVPHFDAGWSEARRDQTMPAIAAFIRQFEARFRYAPTIYEFIEYGEDLKAGMVFPALERPASQADVACGDAVFSLEGEGETRLYKLPQRPMGARWVTLKEFPYVAQTLNTRTGVKAYPTNYAQDGMIWQAEEVLLNGQWRRFYGYVGKYKLAKAPAAEVEFPTEWQIWSALSRGLDCRVDLPEANGKVWAGIAVTQQAGTPLRVVVSLRNRSGLDQTLPADFMNVGPPPALRPGITLKLARATDDQAVAQIAQTTGRGVDYSRRQWQDVPKRKTGVFQGTGAKRILGPAQDFSAFELSLGDWFEVAEPGTYRLQFIFSENEGGVADGNSNEIFFTLVLAPTPRK